MLSDILGEYEPQWQAPLRRLPEAESLAQMVLAAWTIVRLVAVRLLEDGLTLRAQQPTPWPYYRPRCPDISASGREIWHHSLRGSVTASKL